MKTVRTIGTMTFEALGACVLFMQAGRQDSRLHERDVFGHVQRTRADQGTKGGS